MQVYKDKLAKKWLTKRNILDIMNSNSRVNLIFWASKYPKTMKSVSVLDTFMDFFMLGRIFRFCSPKKKTIAYMEENEWTISF